MDRKHQLFCGIALFAALAAASCSRIEVMESPEAAPISSVPFIHATLATDTRTSFSYSDWTLKACWSEGDMIAVTPDLIQYFNAGLYRVTDPGSSQGKFSCVQAVVGSSSEYGVYYPGDRIKSIAQFTRFDYTGQVQRKSDPMAHLGSYYSMKASVSDYSEIDFTGCDQSSCMRFLLSGMTFDHPTEIILRVIGAGKLYENNYDLSQFYYYTSDPPSELRRTTSLSLPLEGYGVEDSLEAFLMMSNLPVELQSGDILRVTVVCADGSRYDSDTGISSPLTLHGGYCHTLTADQWKVSQGDYTEYPWDGDVVTLQKGIDGVDLIIMGDGFIKADFDNGTYDSIMREACENFFAVEPYASLRESFNVSYVKVPSPERVLATSTVNGAINNGHDTKLSTRFTPYSTSVSGNNDLVREYALNALEDNAYERIKDATILVVINQECRAGTCYNSWYLNNGKDYGQASSIAYMSLGRDKEERAQLVRHECGGHGFGKLADEYYSRVTSFSFGYWDNLSSSHELGIFRNVDKYVTSNFNSRFGQSLAPTQDSEVLWYDMFGTANNYESDSVESLGIFEGANTYDVGFCRPTADGWRSIMSQNTGIYNAISRRQIYYRWRRLSGDLDYNCWGMDEELGAFLEWDAANFLPNMPKSVPTRAGELVSGDLPLAPPVLETGQWRDGRFYKD